jgi:hypothetical protein
MRWPHLLRVEAGTEAFASLVSAAAEAGIRFGWLDLSAAPPPPELERAAALGVLRAVAIGGDHTISVKPRSGPPVLADLLREHFLGCRVVLIRGDLQVASLAPAESAGGRALWTLRLADGTETTRETEALVKRLRSPRPRGRPATPDC